MSRCKVFIYDYLHCITVNLYWFSDIRHFVISAIFEDECCLTFDLSIILIDGTIKQYYFCILREPVIPMSYDLRIVEP